MKMFPSCSAKWFSVLLLAVFATVGRAQLYYFEQTGFTGGGIIRGSFTVAGLPSGAQLSAFPDEEPLPFGNLQSFTLTFSGDSLVPSFTTDTLYGIVYNLDTPYLGDESSGGVEGLAYHWSEGAVTGFEYVSGLGPLGIFGGYATDLDTGSISRTTEAIAVSRTPFPDMPVGSPVPEPSTYGILAVFALVGVIAIRRFKR